MVKFPNQGDGGHSVIGQEPDTVETGVNGGRRSYCQQPDAKGSAIALQVDTV